MSYLTILHCSLLGSMREPRFHDSGRRSGSGRANARDSEGVEGTCEHRCHGLGQCAEPQAKLEREVGLLVADRQPHEESLMRYLSKLVNVLAILLLLSMVFSANGGPPSAEGSTAAYRTTSPVPGSDTSSIS